MIRKAGIFLPIAVLAFCFLLSLVAPQGKVRTPVLIGLIAVCFLMAALPGLNYWLGGFSMHPRYGARRIPAWLGRLLFVLVGLWLLYVGFLRGLRQH
jgi:hypothetical protein